MRDASIYARKRSPYFWISYWTTAGRRHESTGIRVDDPAGRMRAVRLAKEKSEAAGGHGSARREELWGEWVPGWLASKYIHQQRTLDRYQGAWQYLQAYLEEQGLHVPRAVGYAHVLGFVEWRQARKRPNGKHISRNTALCDVRVFSLILREAARRGFASANPAAAMGLCREPTKEKPEMTDDEITRIREAVAERERHLPLPQRWMSTAFEIAIHQGCRLRETQVPLADVDLGRGQITFRAKGRGGGAPHVFTTSLHPGLGPLFEALKRTGADRACVVPRMGSKIWHDLFADLEMEHLCFHCTRVTVITRLARGGVPLAQAMRFVGHASEAVHRIYQRLGTADLSACLAAIGAPGAPGGRRTRGAARANGGGAARSSGGQ